MQHRIVLIISSLTSYLVNVPIFLSSRQSRAIIVVLHTNPANFVRIIITLFVTYLLRPVPSDMQLFIQVVHIMTFFHCGADLIGQLRIQITQIKHNKLNPGSVAPTTSGLETEWNYFGRKGRDGQKKKISKANEKKGKVKGGKDEKVNGQWGKRDAPAPHRVTPC